MDLEKKRSQLWEPLRLEACGREASKIIYTNFENRGGPLFRVENTLQVERKGFPNRRVMTRGPNLVGRGGGLYFQNSEKLVKLGKWFLKLTKKESPAPRDYPLEE